MSPNQPGKFHNKMNRRQHHWRECLQAIMEVEKEALPGTEISVGRRLHEMRLERGLSIRSLAELSSLNFNTLSLIENEKSSPSVSTLQQLAQALQVPITSFFETSAPQQDVVFQKMGHRPRASFSHGSLEDLGAGLTLGQGIPFLLTLEPGADSGIEAIVHTGQEFVYCLRGQLFYTIAGQEYNLGPGDSLLFQSHLPHRWGNPGNIQSCSILILCPAEEEDRSAEQHFMTR